MDEKCAKYTCSRRTRRWFFKILDIVSANPYIIYASLSHSKNVTTRLNFVKMLASKLIKKTLVKRLETICRHRDS